MRLLLFASLALLLPAATPAASASDGCDFGIPSRTEMTPWNTTLRRWAVVSVTFHDVDVSCSIHSFSMSIDGNLVDAYVQYRGDDLKVWHWPRGDFLPGNHQVVVRVSHEPCCARGNVGDLHAKWDFRVLVPWHGMPVYDEHRGTGFLSDTGHAVPGGPHLHTETWWRHQVMLDAFAPVDALVFDRHGRTLLMAKPSLETTVTLLVGDDVVAEQSVGVSREITIVLP